MRFTELVAPTSEALLQELLAAGEASEADEVSTSRRLERLSLKHFRLRLFDIGQCDATT